jgi:hypothetical protein
MLPFGVTIPVTVPKRSEIPEGLMNNPVYWSPCWESKYVRHLLTPNIFFGVIFSTAQLNMSVSNLNFRHIRDNEEEKLDALIRLRDRFVDWRI